jgi:hypothetical protein
VTGTSPGERAGAASGRLDLNAAQRRAIGVRLESMRRLLTELHLAGFESAGFAEARRMLREIESRTDALAPEAPQNVVQATLAQLWVRALELRARHLKSYGPVDPAAAAYLDDHSARLAELVNELVDEYEASVPDAGRGDRADGG